MRSNVSRLVVAALTVLVTLAPARADVRVPAEWEPQAATWMQWPKAVENSYRPAFAEIIDGIQAYQRVEVLVASTSARSDAQAYLAARGVPLANVGWHIMSYDWAWMRDNGPVWVEVDGALELQDWGFNGWGGEVPYWGQDDGVPCQVASVAQVPCNVQTLVNERGTLEFNGAGALITSWTVLEHRNPGVTQAEWEALFASTSGVDQVVWLEGAHESDFTRGHTDGIARFIDAGTVAVARYVDSSDPDGALYDDAAATIAAAGFDVVRVDVPGSVTYRGVGMAANYMNWLLADGLVVVCGFNAPAWDAAAAATIGGFFPDRDVIVVDVRELWYWGGGVHCVTNDQPFGTPAVGVDDLTGASRPGLLQQNRPNPFRLTTRIHFRTSDSGAIRLRIYDAAGRLVRNLVEGALRGGAHAYTWDGTDDGGRKLSSGTYIYELSTGDARETRKMTLLP